MSFVHILAPSTLVPLYPCIVVIIEEMLFFLAILAGMNARAAPTISTIMLVFHLIRSWAYVTITEFFFVILINFIKRATFI